MPRHRPACFATILVPVLAVLLMAGCAPLPATPAGLHEEVVGIPGPEGRALAATWFRPAGNGPFPLIVLSHGSPPTAAARADMGRFRPLATVQAFVLRGFAVLAPMRRGFGATGGSFEEGYGSCERPDFLRAGNEAAKDILAAMQYGRAQPFIRRDRVVLAGQSVGGFASIAAASRQPDGLIGVANFAGGSGGDPSVRPGEPCAPERMAAAYAAWGATTRVPVLWHYARNDRFFGPHHVRAWFAAFEKAGGRGRLVMQPPFEPDGHALFVARDGTRVWGPEFDRFVSDLRRDPARR